MLTHHLAHAGYGAVALAIGLESMGIPFPGEATMLAALAIAATGHGLVIGGVVGAAAAGATVGGMIGFWIGGALGFRLLLRYGHRIGITERRLKLGVYLFRRYGGQVVFFGRFVAVLRSLAGFLAGANQMNWVPFCFYNLAGAVVWAGLYGYGAYVFGHHIHHLAGPVGIAIGVVAVILVGAGIAFLSRHENQLADAAERALPGRLELHMNRRHQPTR